MSYTCGNCKRTLPGPSGSCPFCKISLIATRCSNCKFAGSDQDFASGRCPRCGANFGGTSHEVCRGCRRLIKKSDWTCPHCGRTDWWVIYFTFGVSAVFLVAGVLATALVREGNTGLGPLGIVIGVLGLAVATHGLVIARRARKRHGGRRG